MQFSKIFNFFKIFFPAYFQQVAHHMQDTGRIEMNFLFGEEKILYYLCTIKNEESR